MAENILEILETTVEKYPDKQAVKDPEKELTYSELLYAAKNIGKSIVRLAGDLNGQPVALFTEKNVELYASLFGAVYAGAFYVYINPEQTKDRIDKILSVLEPKLIIYDDQLKERLDETGYKGHIVAFSELFKERNPLKIYDNGEGDIPNLLKRKSPLYGIFTSGSTGTPKCVLIDHGSVLDFIGHFIETFDFTEKDVIANQAPFDFDVSVKDIYTAIMTGASMLLIPRDYFSKPPVLVDYICDNHATNLTWAVSALCIISGMKGLDYRLPVDIKRVLFSGEVMPAKQLMIWQKALPDVTYVNLYGPSEITCNCTYYVIDHEIAASEKLPLGKVFAGRKVLLLSEDGKEIKEKNVPGEIAVSGESLAIGYYHNEEETKKHFIIRQDEKGNEVRTYLTGDLAQIADDNEIYFAGRKDFQIKHMGHRIELEEIERTIGNYSGVERCCARYDAEKSRIYLYYTGSQEKRSLHIEVKEKLPLYMVPNKFIHVESFIMNKNGKIDRKLLDDNPVVSK